MPSWIQEPEIPYFLNLFLNLKPYNIFSYERFLLIYFLTYFEKKNNLYNVNIIIPRYKRICTRSQRKFINLQSCRHLWRHPWRHTCTEEQSFNIWIGGNRLVQSCRHLWRHPWRHTCTEERTLNKMIRCNSVR